MYDLDYGVKTEKRGKCDKKSVGHGIWRETFNKVENEKYIL
jgi:hypothetical protein